MGSPLSTTKGSIGLKMPRSARPTHAVSTRILHLPQDLQAQILRHLSATERVSTVACVCRAWRRIVFGSSLLWERMGLWLAAGQTGSTGRFPSLLKQLRGMGETTAELELLLGPPCYATGLGPPCYFTGTPSWRGFNLRQLLAAFPRLRSLRLIQLPPALRDRVYRQFALGLSLDQLDVLCQSCTGLVELGIGPVYGDGERLAAALACLDRLPHLRCLSLAVDAYPYFGGSCESRKSVTLQCLSTLTRLKELRCVVHPELLLEVQVADRAVSGLVNLQALELIGLKLHHAAGPNQGLRLPPGLTCLARKVPSWQVLLRELSMLRLQNLSVRVTTDAVHDLGSVACLTQLTRLQVAVQSSCSDAEPYGGGLVLPQVQRLVLIWAYHEAFPPLVDWGSLGSLTYLCLKASSSGTGRCAKRLDFRRFPRLKTLVLEGRCLCPYSIRLPSSLTGLQLERYGYAQLPRHLATTAPGLRHLVLIGCPRGASTLSWRDPSFKGTLSALVSLTSFHCYLFSGHRGFNPHGLGERLPSTVQAREEWADGIERELRRFMPWLTQRGCTVSFQDEWNRDVSGRPPACLARQEDTDDLLSQLRVPNGAVDYDDIW